MTSKNDFSQNENKGYLADAGENAGNKPGWKEHQNEEDFDPWALPELQDFGPKWSGKFLVWLYSSSNFVILQKFSCGINIRKGKVFYSSSFTVTAY